jgi:hypothetical protein
MAAEDGLSLTCDEFEVAIPVESQTVESSRLETVAFLCLQ